MPVFGQKPDTGYSPVRRRGSLWRISFASFFAAQRKRPAGGDGASLQKANAIVEFAEARQIARCGGDENRTGAFRLRATPFLIAEKWGKDAPGDHSIKVPRTPPHGQGGSAPCGIPRGGLRRTRKCFSHDRPIYWEKVLAIRLNPNRSRIHLYLLLLAGILVFHAFFEMECSIDKRKTP